MRTDFKLLNKYAVEQKLTSLWLDDLLDRLQRSAVYSSFDFADVFLQTPVHPGARYKTVFHKCTRKVGYTRMPFGRVNAPAELQQEARTRSDEDRRHSELSASSVHLHGCSLVPRLCVVLLQLHRWICSNLDTYNGHTSDE